MKINPTLHSALMVIGICALMGAAIVVILDLWTGREPNIYGRVFETGLAVLGLVVGYVLVGRECNKKEGG